MSIFSWFFPKKNKAEIENDAKIAEILKQKPQVQSKPQRANKKPRPPARQSIKSTGSRSTSRVHRDEDIDLVETLIVADAIGLFDGDDSDNNYNSDTLSECVTESPRSGGYESYSSSSDSSGSSDSYSSSSDYSGGDD